MIVALSDEVDYLRAQLAMRGVATPGAATNPTAQPEQGVPLTPHLMEVKPYVSDEELDAQVMLDNGEISKEQVAGVLEALGLVPEIDLDNINVSVV